MIPVETNAIAQWLSRLVQIPSVNPEQVGPRAGQPGEAKLAAELAKRFEQLGGEVHIDPVLPDRPNVYALWPSGSDRWIGVDVHMDTVGVEQMSDDPFSGRLADGRVYGRGSVDTKATLAVVLALLEAMQKAGRSLEKNLLVSATCDEEIGARGAPAFARWVRDRKLAIDQLVVAEPTMCGPVFGHKGVLRMRFDVEGKSAHSSQPELGSNAIYAAAGLVAALEDKGRQLLEAPPTTVLGPPTLTVTMMQGGRGVNVVPDHCQLLIDRRVVASENPADLAAELSDLARRRCSLPVASEVLLQIDAFLHSPGTPWIRQLADWAGIEPAIANYCTNAWAYGGLADECVILGPGSIEQAHSDEEWIALSELEKLAGIYARWWGLEP